MASLKAGTARTTIGFANSMAAAIETAMQQEWLAVKGEAMPSAPMGEQDRRILFAAIAQGVLNYLQQHQADLFTTNEYDTSAGHKHELEFTVVSGG